MLKIALSGCNGRMGRALTELVKTKNDMRIVAGFDVFAEARGDYPVYHDLLEYSGEMDVLVDFSVVSALDHIIEYCVPRGIPLMLATTGHSEEQLASLAEAAKLIPIFKSPNMSLGVAVLLDLVRRATRILGGDYDIEVIERHHNQKVDAPSGTAMNIARAIQEELTAPTELVYDRHQRREKRGVQEIGMHAIRGGTIVGEHEILFAGANETISLQHSAGSREVFAAGALHAARFIADCKPGLYEMQDLVAAVQ